MKHLKCLCLLRPTAESLQYVVEELRDPSFGQYHLCTCRNMFILILLHLSLVLSFLLFHFYTPLCFSHSAFTSLYFCRHQSTVIHSYGYSFHKHSKEEPDWTFGGSGRVWSSQSNIIPFLFFFNFSSLLFLFSSFLLSIPFFSLSSRYRKYQSTSLTMSLSQMICSLWTWLYHNVHFTVIPLIFGTVRLSNVPWRGWPRCCCRWKNVRWFGMRRIVLWQNGLLQRYR